jgi:predicted alpha/beta-fold hydrolase
MAAIGFSLGGNVLLKWLGETGKQNPLKAAVAISVPCELNKAAQFIQQGLSHFYEWYFLRCMHKRLSHKYQFVPNLPVVPSELKKMRTLMDFDDRVTAPLHGFVDAREYYTLSSSRQYLNLIEVPTLILHAKDDPLASQDVLPEQHELSSQVELELTETGGHVGFITGKYPWRPEYWLEQRVPDYLREYL